MTRPLVSILTPFHNTAPYLAQCIESVLRQSATEFEYILVDNWSDDGSSEIARHYASIDPRIRLVRPSQFVSQVENYNFALRQIADESAYVKIVQADDWIYESCVEELTRVAEASPRVGIVSSYYVDGDRLKGVGLPYSESVFAGARVCRDQLTNGSFYFGSPTVVMFRAEVVRGRQPFYASNRLHEDTEACYEILSEWDFGFVHQILSVMRAQEDSISSRARDFSPHVLDRLITLRRYGPRFLTKPEYRAVWRQCAGRYNQLLGEAALRRRDAAFWAYHAAGLETIDERLGRRRLALLGATAFLRLGLHPVNTCRRVWQRISAHRE